MGWFLDSLRQRTVNRLKGRSPFSSSPVNTMCRFFAENLHFWEGRGKRVKASDTIDVHGVHIYFQLLKILRSLYSGVYNLT